MKQELKQKAVHVLQAAYIYRNTKNGAGKKDPSVIMSKFRNFRTHIINFKQIARKIRGANNVQNNDIMGTIMEKLVENI